MQEFLSGCFQMVQILDFFIGLCMPSRRCWFSYSYPGFTCNLCFLVLVGNIYAFAFEEKKETRRKEQKHMLSLSNSMMVWDLWRMLKRMSWLCSLLWYFCGSSVIPRFSLDGLQHLNMSMVIFSLCFGQKHNSNRKYDSFPLKTYVKHSIHNLLFSLFLTFISGLQVNGGGVWPQVY